MIFCDVYLGLVEIFNVSLMFIKGFVNFITCTIMIIKIYRAL